MLVAMQHTQITVLIGQAFLYLDLAPVHNFHTHAYNNWHTRGHPHKQELQMAHPDPVKKQLSKNLVEMKVIK